MANLQIMNKIYICIILTCSLFLSEPIKAESIWINKSKGLTGYELTTLAIDKQNSNVIYVGAKGFLFKTVDGGNHWENIFRVPGINKAVNFIAINHHDPKILYIATESGIFKSKDGGTNWQAMPLGIEDNILTLLVDSEDKHSLFAGTERDIFITKDEGKNWTKSSEGLSGINIKSIAQNYIDGKILFAASGNGLFKSEDGSRKWTKIFLDSILDEETAEDEYGEEYDLSNSMTWVSVDPFNPETIYLATKKGVFKSDDNGNSWARLSRIGLSNSCIKNLVLPSYNRGFIFVDTNEGVFRFSEKENMWTELYAGLTSKETIFIVLNNRQDTLWLVTKKGVFKSEGDIYPLRDIKDSTGEGKISSGVYELKELSPIDKARAILQNFSHEPVFREIQEAAIEYAEVHPEKIDKWRRAAKSKALLPKLTFGIDRDKSDNLHWDAGASPDTWVIGPDEEETGWDITCTWDLGELIWNPSQTSIDVRSKLMVQLRDDILDEVTHLYFERRRLQIELLQNPPEDVDKLIEKELRLQELTADIDAMTGGYLSSEIERRKGKL